MNGSEDQGVSQSFSLGIPSVREAAGFLFSFFGLLYGMGWVARANALATLNLGELAVSHESAVAAGIPLSIGIAGIVTLWFAVVAAHKALLHRKEPFLSLRARRIHSTAVWAMLFTLDLVLSCALIFLAVAAARSFYPIMYGFSIWILFGYTASMSLAIAGLLASISCLWLHRRSWWGRTICIFAFLYSSIFFLIACAQFGRLFVVSFPAFMGGFSRESVEIMLKGNEETGLDKASQGAVTEKKGVGGQRSESRTVKGRLIFIDDKCVVLETTDLLPARSKKSPATAPKMVRIPTDDVRFIWPK
jgi:hypothetical protein